MVNSGEISRYMLKNPLPDEYLGKLELDYCFNYTIELAPEQLWPFVSDTSEINRMLGLKKINIKDKNGKLYCSRKSGIFFNKWEEMPWEWETAKEIKIVRIYSRGALYYLRIHCFLSKTEDNFTALTIYLTLIPRNPAAYLILKRSVKLYERKFKQLLEEFRTGRLKGFNSSETEGLEKYAISDLSDDYKNYEDKLNPIRDNLSDHGIEVTVIYRLLNYIITSSDNSLYRIRPKILSPVLAVESGTLIPLLLYSCRYGLLDLSWDIVCPRCRQVIKKHQHLSSIEKDAYCVSCSHNFSTGDMDSIEISFSVNPGIRKTDYELFCSSEIARKPHILLNRTLRYGNTFNFIIPDIETILRSRTRDKKSDGILEVSRDANIRSLYWDDLSCASNLKCSPGSSIVLNNDYRDNELFTIETGEADKYALRPYELFNYYEFRDLFPNESITYGNPIDIGIQNILIIDVSESISAFKNSGDMESYNIIEKYFSKVGEIAKKYRGVIVKSTGELSVLSFNKPLDALQCSTRLISVFDGSGEIPLSARIVINRGPCIAVNLDSPIDYFGHTVNITSRLRLFTEAGEILMTENFAGEQSVNKYLQDKKYSFKNISRMIINGADETLFRKIRVKKAP